MHRVYDDNGTSETYEYDGMGRAIAVIKVVDNETFVSRTEYDNFGRVSRNVYPSGFTTGNHYNNYNVLDEIKNEADDTTVWRLGTVNL